MNDQDIISLKITIKFQVDKWWEWRKIWMIWKKQTNKKKTGVKSPKQNNCIANQTIYRPIGAWKCCKTERILNGMYRLLKSLVRKLNLDMPIHSVIVQFSIKSRRKVIQNRIDFALLRNVIGPETPATLSSNQIQLKPIMTWSLAFSCALDKLIYLI